MKITKLGRLVKWLSVTFVALATLLNSMNLFSKEKVEVENLNETKNSVALTKVIKHETIETYNNKIPTAKGIDKSNNCKTISKNILDYQGDNPDSGSILITKEGKVIIALYNKNIQTCIQKGEDNKTAKFVDKPESECKITQNAC